MLKSKYNKKIFSEKLKKLVLFKNQYYKKLVLFKRGSEGQAGSETVK